MDKRIKELAEQAGVTFHHSLGATYAYGTLPDLLERFAELVAAAERESCAKVCDLVAREADDTNGLATYIGKSIRARGEKCYSQKTK
jgi:hypothetical protein